MNKMGRPRKPLPDNFEELYRRYQEGETFVSLAKDCKTFSKSTLRLRIYEKQNKDTRK